MSQQSFSELEYAAKKHKTRRERFLERMDQLIPWKQLTRQIQKHYPKAGNGRKPYPLDVMLRVHCVQLFYNLSDPMMEDTLYEVDSVRRFCGLSLSGAIPDESTILKFRHLLENHDLGTKLFKTINKVLDQEGLMLREGTIVDASLVAAPTSTKNKDGKRDPEMHQTKKGNEWHFGMKMHIGVDDALGLVHSVETGPANEHDITRAAELLQGDETDAWGDAGYVGIESREELEGSETCWHVAMRPGRRRTLDPKSAEAELERLKASVRAKVEHPFRYVKRQFDYAKVRYRGLHKNTQRISLLLGFTNLLIAERYHYNGT